MAEGTEIGTAYLSILPSAQGFGAKLQQQINGEAAAAGTAAGKALGGGVTSSVAGVTKSVGGLFAAVGAARFLTGAISEAQEAVKVGNLTNAVIKSTGAAAGVTARQVESLATKLSNLAGIDDEVIQAGENVLLTFCLEESVEALTRDRGWVRHADLHAGDEILTYDPTDDSIRWDPVDSMHRFAVDGDLVRWRSKQIDVATTPHHRWWTVGRSGRSHAEPAFRTTEEISGHQIYVKIGGGIPACFADEPTWSDELIELAGWVATEGWYVNTFGQPIGRADVGVMDDPTLPLEIGEAVPPASVVADRNYFGVGFCQSETANQVEVKRIRLLVDRLRHQGHQIRERLQVHRYNGSTVVSWMFARDLGRTIKEMLPGKKLTPGFLSKLTEAQARLLLEVLIAGDGHVDSHGHAQYIQKDPGQLDMIAMLAAMLGVRTSMLGRGDSIYLCETNRLIGANVNAHPERYEGIVWCPHIRTGVFLARCNGRTFWTGNTQVRNQVGAGNDIFNRATTAALDMSAALGTDLQGSVIQLGKALNDPIQGMTALSRVGVSFTEQQKDQIKVLQESGDLLGAQKIVLGEVSREFGGAAAANATGLDKLHVAVGNLQESLGTALLPTVNAAAGGLTGMLGVFTALPAPIQAAGGALATLAAGSVAVGLIAPKITAARDALNGMGAAGRSASSALGTLGKVGGAIAIAGVVAEASDAIQKAILQISAGDAAPVNALTKGLVDLGTTGKVTGELARQLGGDLGQLGDKASDVALAGWVQGLNHFNAALGDSTRDIDGIDKGLAGLVSSGHADVAAKALGILTDKVRESGGDALADKFVGKMNDYDEALNGVDVQALLTGTSLDSAGDAAGSAGDQAKAAAAKWDDLHGNLEDLVASDWSKTLASNFASALNPLEHFTFSGDKDIAGLKDQVATAKTDLDKATADLAKLQVTGTAGDVARIRGQAGDIDGARAAVDTATRKFNDTKALLAEAQKSPLGSIGENLQSNLGGLTTWLANYEKVATSGHESLANHLVSLGPEAANALAEAVGASPKQLDSLQGMWDTADAKITQIMSGQFELNIAQAARPGETLAQIVATRYEESITPKLTQATLHALQVATDAILAGPGGGSDFLKGYFSGDAPGAPTVAPQDPVLPSARGPVAALPAASPLPGGITFEGGIHVTTATDADPRQIAAETADHIAWRLTPVR